MTLKSYVPMTDANGNLLPPLNAISMMVEKAGLSLEDFFEPEGLDDTDVS